MEENNKCECCNGIIKISMGNQRYCSNCGMHIREIRAKTNALTQKIKNLENKLLRRK